MNTIYIIGKQNKLKRNIVGGKIIMFNFDSNNLFEISLKYENIINSNLKLTNEQKLIIRSLMLTQSLEKTIFLTEESKDNILKGYMLLKKALENSNVNHQNDNFEDNVSQKKRREQINRSDALKYVIDRLSKSNPGFKVTNKNYNSITANHRGNEIQLKIKLSNNFSETHHRSWHKENVLEIEKYDYHIYLVENQNNQNNKYKTLLFKTQEIQQLISQKQINKNNIIHYYFDWGTKNRVYDERENVPLDVTFADADTEKKWKL
jgi:hypothetical protein